jgi:uncharacterized protein (DUF2147 family)
MIRALAFIFMLISAVPAHAAGPLYGAGPANGASLVGLWLTQDHDGVMLVSTCNGGGLCVEIAGVILDSPSDPTPVDYRGISQCHLRLVSDAKPVNPNLWRGHILDPRNGSLFGVELHLDPRGNLALRGFLGLPMFGETQTWTRFPGKVPSDCRMSTSMAEAETLPPMPERIH